MGDIGDGDPQHKTAPIGRVYIRFGTYRIVAVTRIGRVDGEQGQIAQVFARAHGGGEAAVSLGHHGVGEGVGDAVLVDGNQRYSAWARRVAQARGDAGLGQTHLALAHQFSLDQLAIAGVGRGIAGHAPFFICALVDGHDPPAFGPKAKDPQHFGRIAPQGADQPRFIAMIFGLNLGQAGQNAVASAQGSIALLRHDQNARPFGRHARFQRDGEQIAVGIGGQHFQHGHRGQGIGIVIMPRGAGDGAFLLKLFEHALEVNAGIALDPKGPRDVALGQQGRVVDDPLADLVFGGHRVHPLALSRVGFGEKASQVAASLVVTDGVQRHIRGNLC